MIAKRFVFLAVTVAVGAVSSGCATERGDEQVANLVRRSVDASRAHHSAGRVAEAAVMMRAVERVAPEDAGFVALEAEIGEELRPYVAGGLLGFNRRPRTRVERSVLERILLYPVDRVADLVDLVSFEVGFALGGSINAHVTRAVQAGFGMGWRYGVGLVQPRIVGAQEELEIGVVALNYGDYKVTGRRSGMTGPVATGSDDVIGAQTPDLAIFQDYRDYWGVGASFTLGVVGASAEIHTAQILDLLLGFVGLDPANDDYATTRALALNAANRRALLQLNEVEEVRQYAPPR